MEESLFGHLVYRFSSSPENLATEALSFLLNRSHTAREAFRSLLGHVHVLVPENLRYETQDADQSDGAIPDLVGRDASGNPVLYGEAKFWAGLTDNQPVTYLQRLRKANGKALIFLAPAKRFPTLWPELLRRSKQAGLQVARAASDISEIKVLQVQERFSLVLMSWRVVLNAMRQALEAENDREMVSNLIQLEGLCARMDELAFLPIQSEELTSNISNRLIQYVDIVDEVTSLLQSEKLVSTVGLRATNTRVGYLHYMTRGEIGLSFEFNPNLWNKYAATPFWLGIAKAKPKKWAYDAELREKLISLEMETPPRLFQEGTYLYVPIFVETGVEKPEVVNSMLAQIIEIFHILFD